MLSVLVGEWMSGSRLSTMAFSLSIPLRAPATAPFVLLQDYENRPPSLFSVTCLSDSRVILPSALRTGNTNGYRRVSHRPAANHYRLGSRATKHSAKRLEKRGVSPRGNWITKQGKRQTRGSLPPLPMPHPWKFSPLQLGAGGSIGLDYVPIWVIFVSTRERGSLRTKLNVV